MKYNFLHDSVKKLECIELCTHHNFNKKKKKSCVYIIIQNILSHICLRWHTTSSWELHKSHVIWCEWMSGQLRLKNTNTHITLSSQSNCWHCTNHHTTTIAVIHSFMKTSISIDKRNNKSILNILRHRFEWIPLSFPFFFFFFFNFVKPKSQKQIYCIEKLWIMITKTILNNILLYIYYI